MNEFVLLRDAFRHPFNSVPKGTQTIVKRVGSNRFENRLFALDLARFLAMVFMMQGHVLDALVSRTVIDIDVFPWSSWHLLRGLTAPIFLMVSGAVHAFATKRDERGIVRKDVIAKRIRWGLTIIGIGYLLVFPAGRVWDLPFVSKTGWGLFFAVNILQLTGVSILMFIVTMASTTSVKQMGRRALLITALIIAITPVMQLTNITMGLPDWIRAYLTSFDGSIFPIFPFSAYLFFGLAGGSWLHEVPIEHRDAALKYYGWRVGALITLLAIGLQITLIAAGISNDVMEHQMSAVLFMRRVGIVLIFFSLCVKILEKTYQLRHWYSLFGTKSLYIYVIHLLLLFGTPWISGIGRTQYRSFDLVGGIAIAASIILVTLTIAWLFDWYAKQQWALRVRTMLFYVATSSLVYLLII